MTPFLLRAAAQASATALAAVAGSCIAFVAPKAQEGRRKIGFYL